MCLYSVIASRYKEKFLKNFHVKNFCSYSINEHFATYEIFQVIECLQNLLEDDGSQDAHLNFQNRGNASQ